jgi:HEAT repeat protein
LLHSDPLVLTQALEHFGASSRTDWISLARRLLSDGREGVRMAAARALAMHDALDVERLAQDVGPRVRGYAAVELALRDGADDLLEHDRIEALLHKGGAESAAASLGMLAAIADARPTPSLSRLLLALSGAPDPSPEHAELLAHAAARQHDARLVPRLVDLLSVREAREAARSALVVFGDEGLQAVWWALRDTRRPRSLRIHVPKTIARFGTRTAAEYLLENIETEEDGLVRQKSVHALELLVAQRRILLERVRVERLAYATLVRHFRFLEERVALEASPVVAGHASVAYRLLIGLLDDKLRQSLSRVFRLLGIAHPREDFRRVRLACLSDDPYTRANAGELIDALLRHRDQQRLRELLRLVTEDLPPAERAARAAALMEHPVSQGRGAALSALMHGHDRDPVLAELAAACAQIQESHA